MSTTIQPLAIPQQLPNGRSGPITEVVDRDLEISVIKTVGVYIYSTLITPESILSM
ncbi:unnamed protein product, partial [Heterobilharzia americana]